MQATKQTQERKTKLCTKQKLSQGQTRITLKSEGKTDLMTRGMITNGTQQNRKVKHDA